MKRYKYHNLLKISPPLFLNEVVAKVTFSLESTPTYLCRSTYSYARQEALKNQHCARESATQMPFAVTSASAWLASSPGPTPGRGNEASAWPDTKITACAHNRVRLTT